MRYNEQTKKRKKRRGAKKAEGSFKLIDEGVALGATAGAIGGIAGRI
jgi:hypothetical protein